MYQVIKRDGTISEFNISKIGIAIEKAFASLNKETHQSVIDLLALKVTSDFENKIIDGKVNVEDIQDSVEKILSITGYSDVAKAYILYRKQREKVRNIKHTITNYQDIIDNYRQGEKSDHYCVGGLISSNSGQITKNYWLSDIYDEEIKKSVDNNYLFIHHLEMLTGEKSTWSIKTLINEGLGGVQGQISSLPAKHLSSLCNQMYNFIMIMQNEWASNQSFYHFDTYLAPFIKKDKLTYEEVKNCLETFIYGVNVPSRNGSLAPLTYIQLDIEIPEEIKNRHVFIAQEKQSFTYGECQEEVNLLNQALFDLIKKGDALKKPFPYPRLTYTLNKDNYNKHELFYNQVLAYSINKPIVYTNNNKYGLGKETGVIGSISVNLVRIYHDNPNNFKDKLKKQVEIAKRALKIKKEVLSQLLKEGLYPYTNKYRGTFNDYQAHIGLIGIKELLDLMHLSLYEAKGIEVIKDIIEYVKSLLKDESIEYKCILPEKDYYNYQLYEKDKEVGIKIKGNDYHSVPIDEYQDDMIELVEMEKEIVDLIPDTLITLTIEENMIDYKQLGLFLLDMQEKYGINYLHIEKEKINR